MSYRIGQSHGADEDRTVQIHDLFAANAEAYARQQELVDRMRSVDELKTVFLATASHELRTPVTAIVGFSTLLLTQWDDIDPALGRGLMERVLANGRRLDNLIEQLLDFSRLERGLPQADDATVLAAMAAEPRLIERPLVETGKGVRLCRPKEKVFEILQ